MSFLCGKKNKCSHIFNLSLLQANVKRLCTLLTREHQHSEMHARKWLWAQTLLTSVTEQKDKPPDKLESQETLSFPLKEAEQL